MCFKLSTKPRADVGIIIPKHVVCYHPFNTLDCSTLGQSAPDDLIRQHDELTGLGEIFLKEEFTTYSNGSELYAIFEAQLLLPDGFVLLLPRVISAQRGFPVRHLPPIRLIVSLPPNYPSQRSPYFTLSCSWLSKSKLDLLVVELERLWGKNHREILYDWIMFLTNESLEYLKIDEEYDVSEKCSLDFGVTNSNLTETTSGIVNDNSGKITNVLKSKATEEESGIVCQVNGNQCCPEQEVGNTYDFFRVEDKKTHVEEAYKLVKSYHGKEATRQLFCELLEYNMLKTNENFHKTDQECNICLSAVNGNLCKKLNCGHVSCTECLKQMCDVYIKHGSTELLVCAQEDCGVDLPVNLIQDLVSRDVFDQYDQIVLNKTLHKMSNGTYCPRVRCQYPITDQSDDSLAICPKCDYTFCKYCRKAYHTVENCQLQSDEKRELVEAYKNGTREEKLKLEKRYSKKQLMELVSTSQSEQWMKQNSKKCPNCNVNIEKNDGCNKIVCMKCNARFCWLCLSRLPSTSPYSHFLDMKSLCFNMLFEVPQDEDFE